MTLIRKQYTSLGRATDGPHADALFPLRTDLVEGVAVDTVVSSVIPKGVTIATLIGSADAIFVFEVLTKKYPAPAVSYGDVQAYCSIFVPAGWPMTIAIPDKLQRIRTIPSASGVFSVNWYGDASMTEKNPDV